MERDSESQISTWSDLPGYLADKKTPTPIETPQDPGHRPTAGSWGSAFSCKRGTPVRYGVYFARVTPRTIDLADTGGSDVIPKEAWPFYRASSGVRLCWELEEAKGPKGPMSLNKRFALRAPRLSFP